MVLGATTCVSSISFWCSIMLKLPLQPQGTVVDVWQCHPQNKGECGYTGQQWYEGTGDRTSEPALTLQTPPHVLVRVE